MSSHATSQTASPIVSLLEQMSDKMSWQDSPSQPRWGLIRRARRDIQAGLHDNTAATKARLDACIDAILADILP